MVCYNVRGITSTKFAWELIIYAIQNHEAQKLPNYILVLTSLLRSILVLTGPRPASLGLPLVNSIKT